SQLDSTAVVDRVLDHLSALLTLSECSGCGFCPYSSALRLPSWYPPAQDCSGLKRGGPPFLHISPAILQFGSKRSWVKSAEGRGIAVGAGSQVVLRPSIAREKGALAIACATRGNGEIVWRSEEVDWRRLRRLAGSLASARRRNGRAHGLTAKGGCSRRQSVRPLWWMLWRTSVCTSKSWPGHEKKTPFCRIRLEE
ncbi:unnamed protein product, partial [Ectocarpus sp. 12 AP-2014]